MAGYKLHGAAAKRVRGPKRPSLGYKAASEYTGLSVRQLQRLVNERRIKHWKTSKSQTGRVMFDPDVLDEFIEEHTVEAS